MRFSHFAGTAVVPTLSRLVLAIVFITAGFNKVFIPATFDEVQATRLRDMGAQVKPKVDPISRTGVGDVSAASDTGFRIRLASQQAAPPEAAPYAAPGASPVSAPLPAGEYEALGLYHIALLCDDHGMRWPFWLAWVAAVTEFVGGILILIGLLSRFWAIGIAIAMATAIALTTWEPYLSVGPFTVARGIGGDGLPDNMLLFNKVGAQLALFVLGLGVFLTGPGPLSLDHLIVRRHPRPTDALGYEIDNDRDDEPPAPRRPRRDPDPDPDPDDRGPYVPDDATDAYDVPVSPKPTIQPPVRDPVRSHERPI